jgi:EAL domain-containing protein (putative c-di-GMP-specific phosphodiesterase class I)
MTNNAVSGAAEGSWCWRVADARIEINAPRTSSISDLSGEWSLEALSKMLEGLSSGRLSNALLSGDGPVRCALNLSNGRSVHLVGAFVDDTEARGILLKDDVLPIDDHGDEPGPDLTPFYQPIISLKDGSVAGFEALARWNNAESSPLPERFEDEALATNMLIHACETLARLRRRRGRSRLFMHVNLTARDLVKPDTRRLVEALMHGHHLPPKSLRLELTEQAALRDRDTALSAAIGLKEAGAGLVLDDFGSGHSSFSWLADLPADSLKIDPELTFRLGDQRTETILESITLLASRLGMATTAEGVEVKSNAARLRALGFDHVQGFAFARPMGADAAEEFLRAQ